MVSFRQISEEEERRVSTGNIDSSFVNQIRLLKDNEESKSERSPGLIGHIVDFVHSIFTLQAEHFAFKESQFKLYK